MTIQTFTWILGICTAILFLAMVTQMAAAITMAVTLRPLITQSLQAVAQGKQAAQQAKNLFGTVKPQMMSTFQETKLLATTLKKRGPELKDQFQAALLPVQNLKTKTKEFRAATFPKQIPSKNA